jgi:hypothetical protein
MTIDDALFRKAMGSFTSGVTVVTTVHDNAAYGMTVSSFTSLSLKPQLLLVCIQNQLPTHTAILKSGIFAVSILAADQAFISQHFASKIADKFTGINCSTTAAGIPVIRRVPAMALLTRAHCGRPRDAASSIAPTAPIAPASVGVQMAVLMPGRPPCCPASRRSAPLKG